MIFAPLAFFTYIVPSMKKTKMVGWEVWWPETLKLAFLAPVFVFFMYLIVKFLEILAVSVFSVTDKTGLDFLIATMIPFILVMVLMWKAKSIAEDMSGEIGQSITKGMKAVGGVALGAGIGGAALLGTKVIGGAGAAMAKSKWATSLAGGNSKFGRFIGNKAMDAGQSLGKKNFDIRGTKLGGLAGKQLGLDLGKENKQGGFEGMKEAQKAKNIKRAQEIKAGGSDPDKQKANKAEEDLQELLVNNKSVLDEFDKKIKEAGERLTQMSLLKDTAGAEKAYLEQENLKNQKNALKKGTNYEGDITGYGTKTETYQEKVMKGGKAVYDEHGKPTFITKTREVEDKTKVLRDVTSAKDYSKDYTKSLDVKDENGNVQYMKDANGKELLNKEGEKIVQKRTIDYLEKIEVKETQNVVLRKDKQRTMNYAKNLDSTGSKIWNYIVSGGSYSGAAADEAAHAIRMDQKLDSGTKT
jgi:hypothetical protein